MKTASGKQAIYINKLSYTLYKLNGCTNFKTVVHVEDALKLTADIADDMIKELKNKIHQRELEEYVKPYMYGLAELRAVPFIRFNPNYEDVTRLVPGTSNSLDVITASGKNHTISGQNSIIINKAKVDLKALYDNLVKCINFNTKANIYTIDDTHYIFTEDVRRDEAIRKYVDMVNEVLGIMSNKLPMSYKGEMNVERSIKPILRFVETRNKETYRKLLEILGNTTMEADFFNMIRYTEAHFFGLEFVN